ncbi:MAG: DUF484 family protein [Burkholderiales bacterium]|nr:DUF484 family protein [Burkholderiales bacterium]
MRSDEVAVWLKAHPDFFEEHANLLSEIQIPHPHGGRMISISERQTLKLREDCKRLESKLREVIQFGEENDAIGEKVQRISVALLAARDLPGMLNALYLSLREDFSVPHVALRLWRGGGAAANLPEFAAASEATREFAASLAGPYCTSHAMVDTGALFGESAAHLKSFAYLPLREGEPIGLLALASEDAQRFYPGMGTLFLKRLAELIASGFARELA